MCEGVVGEGDIKLLRKEPSHDNPERQTVSNKEMGVRRLIVDSI